MLKRSRYLGFVITGVFIALLLWKIPLHEVEIAFARANYVWVIPAVGCTLLSYILRTMRWKQILRPTGAWPFRTLISPLFIGFMANNLLPARIGEVVRAYALQRKTGLSKSLGLATILVERLCDGLTLVVALGLCALLFPLPSWGRDVGYAAGALFIVITVAIVIVLARQDLAFRILTRVLRPFPQRISAMAREKAASFVIGLRALQSGRDVVVIALWSLVIWAVETTSYFMILKSFHPVLRDGTPMLAALLMMATVNLGILIPSAPGYIGAFQFFAVLALSAFGVSSSVALAMAIVSHAGQWVTVTGIGLVFLLRESLGWKLVSARNAQPELGADVAAEVGR